MFRKWWRFCQSEIVVVRRVVMPKTMLRIVSVGIGGACWEGMMKVVVEFVLVMTDIAAGEKCLRENCELFECLVFFVLF
jgi:hypothetical protein